MCLDKCYDPLKAGSIDGTDNEPHDRAVTRALSTSYKPNKFVKGDPCLTLFVARLNPKTDEETLWSAFGQFGKIKQCRLVRDMVTGFSKCYGFIEFEDERAMRLAHREGHKMEIDEKEILVDYEQERTLKNWVPRRLGGGFGGKKESGQLRFGGRDRPFRKPITANPKWGGKGNDGLSQSRNRSDVSVSWHDKSRRDESQGDSYRSTRDSNKSSRDRRGYDDRRQRRHSRSPLNDRRSSDDYPASR